MPFGHRLALPSFLVHFARLPLQKICFRYPLNQIFCWQSKQNRTRRSRPFGQASLALSAALILVVLLGVFFGASLILFLLCSSIFQNKREVEDEKKQKN
jgi:hypothetical protein